MPWTIADVDKHNKGLNPRQKRVWVAAANSAFSRCSKGGGKDCEGQAVRIANGAVARSKRLGAPKFRQEIVAKAHSGAIVCFYLPEQVADQVHAIGKKLLGGRVVPKDELHITLMYLGPVASLRPQLPDVMAAATGFISDLIRTLDGDAIDAVVGGIGRFLTDEGSGENCVYLSVDSPKMTKAWDSLCNHLYMSGVKIDHKHGFTGHITVGYIPEEEPTPFASFEPISLSLDEISLAVGDSCYHFPLTADSAVGAGGYGMGKAAKAVWSTATVNDLPDSSFLYVEPGGKKDADGKTTPRTLRHFPYKDASGKVDLPHLRNALARIPGSGVKDSIKEVLTSRARRLLKSAGGGGAEKSSSEEYKSVSQGSALTVFKQANGKRRWVMLTSNSYRDRDGEFVTHKAHEYDIANMDKTGDYGVLRWWHLGKPYFEKRGDWTTVKAGPGLDLGVCDFVAMHGRIRVESGTFYSEEVGAAVEANADGLEGSLGYAHPESEPDRGKGYLHIKTFERSLTPKGEASNLFTSLLVSSGDEPTMDSTKKKALSDLGVDIDEVLRRAEASQTQADKRQPYRMKSAEAEAEGGEDPGDLASKLDGLYEQLAALQQTIKEGKAAEEEPEQKLEDLMLHELTVGEFQDVIKGVVASKSTEPIAIALKAIFEELQEVKELLTSKSVQSVVDEVSRMKAKLERLSARTNGIGSRVRELTDEQPSIALRSGRGGVRPSQDDGTIFSELEDGDLSSKSNGNNPFSWIDTFIDQKQ